MIGREKQLAYVLNWASAINKSTSRALFISGEAGTGKTTLINQVIKRLFGQSKYIILSARCDIFQGSNQGYTIAQSLFEQTFAVQKTKNELRRHIEFVSKVAPSWLSTIPGVSLISAIANTITEYNEIYGTKFKASTQKDLEKEFIKAISGLQKKKKVLIIVEDIHWADPGSVKLLQEIATNESLIQVNIICSFRPTEVKSLGFPGKKLINEFINNNKLSEIITLPPFDIQECDQLVKNILGKELPEHSLQEIHRLSGGVPFYVEQMALSLVSRTTSAILDIYNAGGLQPGKAEVLREIVSERLDRLPPATQNIYRCASVEGIEFTYEIVRDVLSSATTQFDEIEYDNALELLERTYSIIDFVEEIKLNDETRLNKYQFTHGIFQRTIYSLISPPAKGKYHRLFASIIEKYYGGNPLAFKALAFHHQNAGEYKKAALYFIRLAEQSEKLYETYSTIENLEAAVACLKKLTRNKTDKVMLFDCFRKLADQYANQLGDFVRGAEYYKASLDIVRDIDQNNHEFICQFIHMLGVCSMSLGKYDDAAVYFSDAQNYSQKHKLKLRQARVLRDLARLKQLQNKHKEAIKIIKKSEALIKNSGNHYGIVATKLTFAISLDELGEHQKAEKIFNECEMLYEKNPTNPRLLMQILIGRYSVENNQGKIEGAKKTGEKAHKIGVKHSYFHQLSELWLKIGEDHGIRNRYTSAFRAFALASYYAYQANMYQYQKILSIFLNQVDSFISSGNKVLAIRAADICISLGKKNAHVWWGEKYSSLWVNVRELALTSNDEYKKKTITRIPRFTFCRY